MTTENDYASLSDSAKKKEDWMNAKWRPMMGWSYMLTCIMDFVIFPILWSVAQMVGGGEVKMQWQPITLMGAGLYHVAMGAVLGLAAWGRTQEKMSGANNGGLATSQPMGTSYVPPAPSVPQSAPKMQPTPQIQSAPVSSFSSQSAMTPTGQVVTGYGGKPAPVLPPDPEI